MTGSRAPADAGPSMVMALREQRGLKLESGKAPVEKPVVDLAEKASRTGRVRIVYLAFLLPK